MTKSSPRQIPYSPAAGSPLFYQNPFPISDIGDPFVLKAKDGRYYLFATSSPNGYYCWQSSDLVNWTGQKMAYTRQAGSWALECFWAPEVVEHGEQYYMFYTAKGASGSLRIGVAVSDTPDGPYLDASDKPLFDLGYAAIDANVLVDEDGKSYLYFSKDCSENRVNAIQTSQIYGAELSEDLLSLKTEPILLTTPDQLWELGNASPVWNEGPEMLKHNGQYYLTYSANAFWMRSYSVGYAVSQSPLGPFVKAEENPILTSGRYENISGSGHHSFVASPDGSELFFVYHTHTFPKEGGGNRQVNIDRLRFTEDGKMYADGPTISPQPIPSSPNASNVVSKGTVLYGDTQLPLLNDGIFAIHKKDASHVWTQAVDLDGTVTVTVRFSEEQTLSGLCLYRGAGDSADFSQADILLDGDRILKAVTCPEADEERAAAITFPPESVKEVSILLRPREGQQEVSLSEIALLSGDSSTVS